jgi:hypothetical protein
MKYTVIPALHFLSRIKGSLRVPRWRGWGVDGYCRCNVQRSCRQKVFIHLRPHVTPPPAEDIFYI